jgi:hypothetical protein
MSNFKSFYEKNFKLCLYLIFPSPLILFFIFSIYQRNIEKSKHAKSSINTDIKVLQGDSTIDDPFAYFDDKEANKDNTVDYSGNMDLDKLKERNKHNYEEILNEEKKFIEEQDKVLYKEYKPSKSSPSSYNAEEIVNKRKRDYYSEDEYYDAPRQKKASALTEEAKTPVRHFNTVSSSNGTTNNNINKAIATKPIKIMAIQTMTYKSGNSIKFKLLEAYNTIPKGTTIIGNIKINGSLAIVSFPGSQLDETTNLELYSLNMERGITIEPTNQNLQETKDEVRGSASSTAGEIVRNVPIIGGTAERIINREGNRRRNLVPEVEILSGEKFYLSK